MRFQNFIERAFASCVLFGLWLMSTLAVAQTPSELALFKTSSTSTALSRLATALDPILQAELGKTNAVNVASVPPLDLPSLQLALDCVGETPECLAGALQRSNTDVLLSPGLARNDDALVLSLLLYDPRESSALQVVTRRMPADSSDAAVFDAAAQLLRQLFPAPAAPSEPQAPPASAVPTMNMDPEVPVEKAQAQALEPPPAAPAATIDEGPEPAHGTALLLPIAIGAAGLVAVATGVGFGLAAQSSEREYANTFVATPEDARHANDLLDTAGTQATVANIALGIGVAACAGAGVLWFLKLSGDTHPDNTPQLGLGPGWLSYTGDF